MKTLTIGDIHGRIIGLEIAKQLINTVDKVIFIGDYVDSYDIKPVEIMATLNGIIEFKKQYPDKVELLLGNHDVQYIVPNQQCSGYVPTMHFLYAEMFRTNSHLFNIAFQEKNYLWTHAGVHTGWFNNNLLRLLNGDTIADKLNELWHRNLYKEPWYPLFQISYYRGGSSSVGGPLWADKNETNRKSLKGYHQIVGHTAVKKIQTIFPKGNDKQTSITYTDVLGNLYSDISELFYIKDI